jgi:hypothetical protein
MSASLTLSGMAEMVKALGRMPDGLQDKAAATVRQAAIETASELRTTLPQGETGNLRRGVRMRQRDPLVWQVLSAAPHAFINEEGTKVRRTRKTRANRGISPPSKVVAKVAASNRRQMNAALEQVLVQVLSEVR